MIDFSRPIDNEEVFYPPLQLPGLLSIPAAASGLVVFAHGSGSSRFSPRNMTVAAALNTCGFGTLLLDLLTEAEQDDRAYIFNIPLLTARLVAALDWINSIPELQRLPIGLFGASTGAAAALSAAALFRERIGAVVSRGGRPDMARAVLADVTAPTLLIVGGDDTDVLAFNRQAFELLRGPKALEVIVGASHLFPEPGAMDQVIEHAAQWFRRYLNL